MPAHLADLDTLPITPTGRVEPSSAVEIAELLKYEADGVPVQEICRKMGISELTFYRWRGRAVRVSDGWAEGSVKVLKDQVRTLRRMLAFHALDIQKLRDRLAILERRNPTSAEE